MKLTDRVKLAVDAFRGNVHERAIAQMTPTWETMQPKYSEVNFENMVRFGLRKNELIWACIQANAEAAAQVTLQVKNPEGKLLEEHPLAKLLHKPNAYMNEFDFWASVIIYQALAGRAIYEKERNNGGRVIALHPLRPDWIAPVPGKNTPVAYYEYRPPGLSAEKLLPEDVLDFKLFDPINQYNGYPPVAVAARVADVDNAATDFLRIFWQKGGTPPGLLKTKQKLQDSEVQNIRRRWAERYGGYDKWTEPAVLDMDAEYQATGSSFKDMMFSDLDIRSEVRICMVMGVPPLIVGATIGLDRAIQSNAVEIRKGWWEDKLIPKFRNMQDTIQNQLLVEYGNNVRAEWDFSEVPALQESQDAVVQRIVSSVTSGFMTVNEAREAAGLPALGPTGDVFLRGIAISEAPAKTMRKSAPFLTKADPPPYEQERNEIEQDMRSSLEDFLGDQLERIAGAASELMPATT